MRQVVLDRIGRYALVSAQEIVRAVQLEWDVSERTVYRALARFVKEGVLERVHDGNATEWGYRKTRR